MKRTLVLALVALLVAAEARAERKTLASCLATEILDTEAFGEFFSVSDYPEVRVFKHSDDGLEVNIGMMLVWKESNEDDIDALPSDFFHSGYEFRSKEDRKPIRLEIDSSHATRAGKLYRGTRLVAKLDC